MIVLLPLPGVLERCLLPVVDTVTEPVAPMVAEVAEPIFPTIFMSHIVYPVREFASLQNDLRRLSAEAMTGKLLDLLRILF